MEPHDGSGGAADSASSAPSPRGRALAVVAWSMLALGLGCGVVAALSAEAHARLSLSDAVLIAAGLVFSAVGALSASRHPTNILSWVFAGLGLSAVVHVAGRSYAEYGLAIPGDEPPGLAMAAWASGWSFMAATSLLLVLVPLLFPNGRPASPTWRPLVGVAGAFVLAVTVASALRPGRLADEDLPFDNPVGIAALDVPLAVVAGLSLAGLGLLVPVAVASLARRYRNADSVQRDQIKWLLYPVAILAVGVIADDVILNGLAGAEDTVRSGVIESVGVLGIPVGAGIAVLRHRLLDIDLVIQRSVVFGALVSAVAMTYAVLVSAMAELLPEQRGVGLFLATGIVAVLFAPVRERIEGRVSRFLYGERRDPYAAVSRLGRQLDTAAEPSAVLPLLAETLAQTLKLSYAAIEVDADAAGDASINAEVGTQQGEVVTVPLRYQGLTIGSLKLAARGRGDRFSPADRELIDDVARLAALTAHSIRLAGAVQRSRRDIVIAREAERARLRRDLHDGLGPTLAGVAFQLAGVAALAEPAALEERMAKLKGEIHVAIGEVRRLVDGLRPPALDELGLKGAIERHASAFDLGPENGRHMLIDVDVADGIGCLAAAAEVAAYRIVTEALTNAARHARASRCTVRIWADAQLHVEVADDGRGIDDERVPGVGLRSMHDRAAEVGGELVVDSRPGAGTRIRAHLPLDRH